MKTYFIGYQESGKFEWVVQFETDSLKAAKAWATRNRYYLGRLRVPDIYIRLLGGRVELAAFGEYQRRTARTKWVDVY
jgi:hypothetical protein